ncbi:toll/interleukin-1 receptor domain-containing protein [Bradyrhizobium sediminis]|uniref:Toll/interleukin-1 receptor domain-containing protein n=2 Tax=Bradyrhizobium sediminis TaxID=2840469 RepID=A0A975NP63_9BRAD|nr:toll/interleukin-1 receptor domain-containing protein [Bradyrhizobium sediminis]
MIRFSMGGKNLDPRNLKDAVMASVLEGVRNQIREKVGNIRDPDTGEFPTIVIRGNSLDDLKIQVEGSPALVALVNERLGLEAAGEPSAAPESQPHVFISYTSEDIDIARRVAEALRGAGIEVWWDKWCISSGDSLRQKIDEGIGGCTHFLVLLTPRSINKPWVNQEMDAGLIRKLNDQCRFLPVRHELPASELPPLLSGIASASIVTDADVAQLIHDIYALTRKPPRGPAPAAVQNSRASQTGYSAAANAIARYFVEKSEDGLFGDPICEVDELAKEVGLSVEDTEDAIQELSGFLRLSTGHVLVEGTLFAEFDRYWKPWSTADDALRLAADIMSDPKFPDPCEEIAKLYQWEPRRLNSTAYYLLERSLIVDYQGIGTAPWAVFRIVGNQNMRRFVKSRS